MDFFIVSSPLQLNSALSIIDNLEGSDYHLHVRLSSSDCSSKNDKLILKEASKFPNVNFSYSKPLGLKIVQIINYHFELFYLCFKLKGKVKRVYFGSFYNYYFSLIRVIFGKSVENILIDDGMATVTAQFEYLQYRKHLKYPRPFIANRLFKILERLFGKIDSTNVISRYDITSMLYLGQDFLHLITPPVESLNISDNQIYFVGCPFSENGIISIDDELLMLTKFYESYEKFHVVYFPHRYDSESKLKNLEGIGFDVVKLDLPLEEHIIRSGQVGKIICSFTSTVLYNISKLCPRVGVLYINPVPFMKEINEINKYSVVVKYYEGLGFEQINI